VATAAILGVPRVAAQVRVKVTVLVVTLFHASVACRTSVYAAAAWYAVAELPATRHTFPATVVLRHCAVQFPAVHEVFQHVTVDPMVRSKR
jgi:hypothetical protein